MPAQLGKLVLKKTGAEDGSPLAGAEFELRIKKSGKVVATLVTDEEGIATSGDIPIASYKDGKMQKRNRVHPGGNQSTGWLCKKRKRGIRCIYLPGR